MTGTPDTVNQLRYVWLPRHRADQVRAYGLTSLVRGRRAALPVMWSGRTVQEAWALTGTDGPADLWAFPDSAVRFILDDHHPAVHTPTGVFPPGVVAVVAAEHLTLVDQAWADRARAQIEGRSPGPVDVTDPAHIPAWL